MDYWEEQEAAKAWLEGLRCALVHEKGTLVALLGIAMLSVQSGEQDMMVKAIKANHPHLSDNEAEMHARAFLRG